MILSSPLPTPSLAIPPPSSQPFSLMSFFLPDFLTQFGAFAATGLILIGISLSYFIYKTCRQAFSRTETHSFQPLDPAL